MDLVTTDNEQVINSHKCYEENESREGQRVGRKRLLREGFSDILAQGLSNERGRHCECSEKEYSRQRKQQVESF